MSRETQLGTPERARLEAQTDEGAQELRPLSGEARERELVMTGGPCGPTSTTR